MIKFLKKRLNEYGKIKIGRKGEEKTSSQGNKFRQPEKIDHFIVTTNERDNNGDFIKDTGMMEKIKNNPSTLLNKDGNIVGIPIRLLYNDLELNFPHQLSAYSGGKMVCCGNGETAHARITNFKTEIPCPCNRFDPGYTGKDKCKAVGSLTCIIDDAVFFGEVHKFRTTSINSIEAIVSFLELLAAHSHGHIAGIPLMLIVNNKTTSTPSGASTTIQVVSICYRGNLDSLLENISTLIQSRQNLIEDIKLIESEARAAGAGEIFSSESDEVDFVQEFRPDQQVATEDQIENNEDEKKEEVTQSNEQSTKEPEPIETPIDKGEDTHAPRVDLEDKEDIEVKAEKGKGRKKSTKKSTESQETTTEITPEPVEKIMEWPKGDKQIERSQLIEIAGLKSQLKIFDMKKWEEIIVFYKDIDGFPITRANNISFKQAENLIDRLKKM